MTKYELEICADVWEALLVRVTEGFSTMELDLAESLEHSHSHDETETALAELERRGIARCDEDGEWYVTVEGEDWDGKFDDG